MVDLITEASEWREALQGFSDADVYHTWDYHQLASAPEEHPVLLHYHQGKTRILFPFLLRKIKGSLYLDVTSVYGYPGPVGMHLPSDNSHFITSMHRVFLEKRVVSVFSRLNPFIPYQKYLLSGLGEFRSPGNVVAINTRQEEALQEAQMNSRLRTYIRKCQREYEVAVASTPEAYQAFYQLYEQTMTRVGASKAYFFSPAYFEQLRQSADFEVRLLLARETGKDRIAAGVLFMGKNGLTHYHLSGVHDDFLKLNPVKMLIDEGRKYSSYHGQDFLNLGGGVGNKCDSLFRFKQGYSKELYPFNLWCCIVDQQHYSNLVQERFSGQVKILKDFFPLYRSQQDPAAENPLISRKLNDQ